MEISPNFRLRDIVNNDNQAIAQVIRECLIEFNAARSGTAWEDPELDTLSCFYSPPKYRFLVVESHGKIVGGAGYAPFECSLKSTCELQKMYLIPTARGHGLGHRLMNNLEVAARKDGYANMYLETLTWMEAAQKMYQNSGYQKLDEPLGNSGHGTCNSWYVKAL